MSNEIFEPVVTEIQTLNLGKNDYLAIKFPENMSSSTLSHAVDMLKEKFPELRMIVFVGDVELYVISQNGLEKKDEK